MSDATDKRCELCGSSMAASSAWGLCPGCLVGMASKDSLPEEETLSQIGPEECLRIRCPKCSNRIEVDLDADFNKIFCETCGKTFALVDHDSTKGAFVQRAIGQFDLIEEIGAGSFGKVWKARDTKLDRTVAIKMPRKGQLSPVEAEQFLREARAAAQLRHPSIVAVHELGRVEDTIYIVSDFVRGVTLTEWAKDKPFTPNEVAGLCLKIADALTHAHDAGVIHRDLKPSNIMLDFYGEPFIMDFGLAKRAQGDVTLTFEGRVMGTPAYMSPEQAVGDSHLADGRTDIYSLGALMFELMTGKRPFEGSAELLSYKIIHESPPRPRRINPKIASDLETICLKCLEKNPDKRYQTMSALHDDLSAYSEGRPIQARAVGRTERMVRWCRRNPMLAGVSTVLALTALTLLGVVVAWQFKEPEPTIIRKDNRLEQADYYVMTGLADSQRGENAKSLLWFAHALDAGREDPVRFRSNALRSQTWQQTLGRPIAAHRVNGQPLPGSIRFHPGEKFLTVAYKHHDLARITHLIWDMESDQPHVFPNGITQPTAMTWIKNGTEMLVAADNVGIVRCSFPGGRVLESFPAPPGVTQIDVAPDGSMVYVAAGTLHYLNRTNESSVHGEISLKSPDTVRQLKINNDATLAALCDRKKILTVYRLSKNQSDPAFLWEGKAIDPWAPPDFSEKGLLVPIQSGIGVQWLDPVTNRSSPPIPYLEGRNVTSYAIDRVGNRIALMGLGNRLQLNDLNTGKPMGFPPSMVHPPPPNAVFQIDFHPTRPLIVTACSDGVARIWNLTTGKVGFTIPHQTPVVSAVFSKGIGHLLATAQEDGLLRIWQPVSSPGLKPIPVSGMRGNPISHRAHLSQSRRFVASGGSWDEKARRFATRVWDLNKGAFAGPELVVGRLINGVCLDERLEMAVILSALGNENEISDTPGPGLVSFWSWGRGREVRPALLIDSEPLAAAMLPDHEKKLHRVVVLCAAGDVLIIDARAGQTVRRLKHPGGPSIPQVRIKERILLSPTKEVFAVVAGDTVGVWSCDTLELLHTTPGLGEIFQISFSPDGGDLAIAGGSPDTEAVFFVNAQSGEPSGPKLKHDYPVQSVQFDESGKRVITTCRNAAQIWDRETGRRIQRFEHDDEVWDAIFWEDGRWVVVCQHNRREAFGSLHVWDGELGGRVIPPVRFIGDRPFQLVAHKPGRFLVAGRTAYLYDAQFDFLDRIPDEKLDPALSLLQAELMSAYRLSDLNPVELSTAEWLEKWSEWQSRMKTSEVKNE